MYEVKDSCFQSMDKQLLKVTACEIPEHKSTFVSPLTSHAALVSSLVQHVPPATGADNIFVAIDGPPGTGKSTLAAALAAGLRSEGRSVVCIRIDHFLCPLDNTTAQPQAFGFETTSTKLSSAAFWRLLGAMALAATVQRSTITCRAYCWTGNSATRPKEVGSSLKGSFSFVTSLQRSGTCPFTWTPRKKFGWQELWQGTTAPLRSTNPTTSRHLRHIMQIVNPRTELRSWCRLTRLSSLWYLSNIREIVLVSFLSQEIACPTSLRSSESVREANMWGSRNVTTFELKQRLVMCNSHSHCAVNMQYCRHGLHSVQRSRLMELDLRQYLWQPHPQCSSNTCVWKLSAIFWKWAWPQILCRPVCVA